MRPAGIHSLSSIDSRRLGVDSGSIEAALRDRVEARSGSQPPPIAGRAGEVWLEGAKRLGASSDSLSLGTEVLTGRGLVVMAGQQPGLWGGPLYSLYKLSTAVATAKRISRLSGRPTLAVFWSVGDDSDFGEVSSTWLPAVTGKLRKIRDEANPPSGTLLNGLGSERQLALLEELGPEFFEHPNGSETISLLGEALRVSKNWSEVQAALFYRLCPGHPFLVLDGGMPELLEQSREWLEEAGTTWPLRELLASGADRARELDEEPAFEPELGKRALFRVSGQVREAVEGESTTGQRLAPNVVLRPLLQDWLLPNIATICGAAEVQYRIQLGPVYEHGEILEPVRLLRMKAQLVPTLDLLAAREDRLYAMIAQAPKAFVDERVREAEPEELRFRIEQIQDRLRADLEELTGELGEYDPSLTQLSASAAGKADYQIERIMEGLRGKSRHRFFQRNPIMANLEEFVCPRKKEQERVLSVLTPFLFDGAEAISTLFEESEKLLGRALDEPRVEMSICRIESMRRSGE